MYEEQQMKNENTKKDEAKKKVEDLQEVDVNVEVDKTPYENRPNWRDISPKNDERIK